MISYFKNRLRNQRHWFKYVTGAQALEGEKHPTHLEITVKFQGEWISIPIDRVSAYKLRDWLNRCYPGGGANVVSIVRPIKSLSVPGTTRDTETDPPTSAG